MRISKNVQKGSLCQSYYLSQQVNSTPMSRLMRLWKLWSQGSSTNHKLLIVSSNDSIYSWNRVLRPTYIFFFNGRNRTCTILTPCASLHQLFALNSDAWDPCKNSHITLYWCNPKTQDNSKTRLPCSVFRLWLPCWVT